MRINLLEYLFLLFLLGVALILTAVAGEYFFWGTDATSVFHLFR